MKRMMRMIDLKLTAEKMGLAKDTEIMILERSLLKDGAYITRERRRGIVKEIYPYHFICQMRDGTRESFRYNEFLGDEARLISLWEGYGADSA